MLKIPRWDWVLAELSTSKVDDVLGLRFLTTKKRARRDDVWSSWE